MCSISIIIPVFNAEKFLNKSLNSVISQSLTNFEVLCVDDASTDNSSQIIKRFMKKDNRVKHFKLNKNLGSGSARNLGLDKANGEFVAFLDADDYYSNDYALEILYKNVKKYDLNAAAGNILSYDSRTNKEKPFHTMYFKKNGIMDLSEYYFYGAYQRFIYKRDIIENNAIRFPLYRRRQDPVFFYNLMVIIRKFYACTDNVYSYRTDHKIEHWTEKKLFDALSSYEDNLKLLKKHDLFHHYRIEVNDLKRKFLIKKDVIKTKKIEGKAEQLKRLIEYDILKETALSRVILNAIEVEALKKLLTNINTEQNVVIYGFGNLGCAIYESIKEQYQIRGIIDQCLEGVAVDELVIEKEYSYNSKELVIISILNKKIQKKVLDILSNKGVQAEQIIHA
ncbi:MAG: glycosyltransferase family 2 protein [Thermotogota bacterium]